MRRRLLLVCVMLLSWAPVYAQQPRLDVDIVSDEADAVLSILERRTSGQALTDLDWSRLLTSSGYRRLKQREESLRRAFEDTAFRSFVLSDELAARASQLRTTLAKWKQVNATSAAARALSYLPPAAVIRAKIFPVIKPRPNSFVFETATNPAIFLALDPDISDAQFENTLAHELHHIGFASACTGERTGVFRYLGSFAEGRALLAAAGSPVVHPHETSRPGERAIWERDFAKVSSDLPRLEAFFTAVLDKQLTDDAAAAQWIQFISTNDVPQGPFYTVGYLMARIIEEQLGRGRLIASLCDPLMFLTDYNEAVKKAGVNLPRWSDAFLKKLATPPPAEAS